MIRFLMSTLYRQAASCIFGLAPCMKDILTRHVFIDNRDIDETFDVCETEYSEIDITEDIQMEIKSGISMDNYTVTMIHQQ